MGMGVWSACFDGRRWDGLVVGWNAHEQVDTHLMLRVACEMYTFLIYLTIRHWNTAILCFH